MNLRRDILKYENTINRTDLQKETLASLPIEAVEEIRTITAQFYDAIKSGKFTENSFYSSLDACPTVEECAQNFNEKGCEVVFYGNEELGILSPLDRSALL